MHLNLPRPHSGGTLKPRALDCDFCVPSFLHSHSEPLYFLKRLKALCLGVAKRGPTKKTSRVRADPPNPHDSCIVFYIYIYYS